MTTQDEIFAAETDMILRKTRRLSLAILATTTALAAVAVIVMTVDDPRSLSALALTTSVIMTAWVTRRVIIEIPRYRVMFGDRRIRRSAGVLSSMIAIDALALIVSVSASIWLIARLVGAA